MPKQSTLSPPNLVQLARPHTPTRGWWLRAIFMLAGLGLIVGGALANEAWLAAHLAPNGHITEVAYVYVLRALAVGIGDDERLFSAERTTIVVVGDSIEAWRAVPIAELYPRRLEALLNTQHNTAGVQVLNLGVTGYSLHQKRLMLQYRGLAWQPKLAVVGYCLNDPIPAWELINYFTNKPRRKLWKSVDFLNARVRSWLHPYGLDFYHEGHRPG